MIIGVKPAMLGPPAETAFARPHAERDDGMTCGVFGFGDAVGAGVGAGGGGVGMPPGPEPGCGISRGAITVQSATFKLSTLTALKPLAS